MTGSLSAPLAIDLFAGLGGWTEGLLAEGYFVAGFDIEQHIYGEHRYPGHLVIQDVLTLHGSQFKDAALIVASPPCQKFSYMGMPWQRAKAQAAAIRADTSGKMRADLTALFDACFRIQREASEAAGHHIPLIVENVRGAQEWVGRARWSYGSFYLWGDVPALMPPVKRLAKNPGLNWSAHSEPDYRTSGKGACFRDSAIKNNGGSWLNIGSPGQKVTGQNPDGRRVHRRDGHQPARHLTNPREHEGVKQGGSGREWFAELTTARRKAATAIKNGLKQPVINLSEVGFNVANALEFGPMVKGVKIKRSEKDKRDHVGTSRKFASAMIAKIPLPLSRHIAATFKPNGRALMAAE